MTTCPFCNAEIDEGLSRFGGNCPHCFNLIPGEEAPTDPGVSVAQRPATDEAEGGNKMVLVFAFLAVIAIGAVIGQNVLGDGEPATVEVVQATRAERALERERLERRAEEEALAQEEALLEEKAAEEAAEAQAAARANAIALSRSQQRAEEVAVVQEETPSSAPGNINIRDYSAPLSTGPSREDIAEIVLQTPAQINSAVRRNLRRYKGQLEQCYNIQLNVDETLKGRWQVGFTVETDGNTSGVSVKAMNVKHADLEACMQRQVESWTFPKISQAYPYVKEYSFGR